MPINSACTGCGQFLTVADEHVGKQARCPSCGQIYTVPLRSTIDQSGKPIIQTQSTVNSSTNPFDFDQASLQAEAVPTAEITGDSQSVQNSGEMFWMRASNGQVYGPVNRNNLDRWFREGRVGVDYLIRQGETGDWKTAATFQPPPTPMAGYAQQSSYAATGQGASSGSIPTNPYVAQTDPYAAPTNPYANQTASPNQMRSDKGLLVLILGLLSWFFFCFGLGIAAVIVGYQARRDIYAGIGNPSELTLINVGFWLGLSNIVFSLLFIAAFMLLPAVF